MDAFSLLAAPLAGAEAGPDPSRLISFFAQEMQLFFQHIQAAVVQYNGTGELPPSLFKSRQVKSLEKQAGGKRKKSKRKPTAFNMYMADKMKEYKEKGVKAEGEGRNPLFTKAANEWKTLSGDQKAALQAKYAPIIAAMKEEGEGVEVPGDSEGSDSDSEESEESEDEDEDEEEEAQHPLPKVNGGYADASPKKKKSKH